MNLSRIDVELTRLLRRLKGTVFEPAEITRADSNVQTDLDKKTDEFLRDALRSIADVPIMSEERPEDYFGRSGHCWIVDPIDGTLNAIAGTDDFAICVALVDAVSLRSLAGAVYLPRNDTLYRAVDLGGAFRDQSVLHVAEASGWQQIKDRQKIASFGVPKDGPAVAQRMSAALFKLYSTGWVTRQTGAASIDICRVASGSWSAFFEYGLMYWDFAAACLIAEEAGCSVRAIPSAVHEPNQMPLEYDLVIAKTPAILNEIATAIGLI